MSCQLNTLPDAMAKEPTPDPLRPNFSERAEPTAEQILNRKLDGLSEESRDEYFKVCEDQARAMKYFEEDILTRRELKIEHLTRDIMDQKIKENRLALNPPSAQSNRPLEKLAREEATIKVDMESQERLSIAEASHYEARYRTIQRLYLKEQCLADFKSSNPHHSTRTINRDEGNER